MSTLEHVTDCTSPDQPLWMDRDRLSQLLLGLLTSSFENALSLEEQQQYREWLMEIQDEYLETYSISKAQRQLSLDGEGQRYPIPLLILEGATEKFYHPLIGDKTYILAHEHDVTFDPNRRLVSVLFPLNRAGSRILASLEGLTRELKALGEEFEYEINFCINNSRDHTLSQLARYIELHPDVPVNIYEFDKQSLTGAGKNFAIDFLLDEKIINLKARRKLAPTSEIVLHIADDDIGYPEIPGGLLDNISLLNQNPELKAVSAVYSTGRRTEGFHFLNSIRKHPKILREVGALPQAYGGALTIKLDDFPASGLPANSSFDAFITSYYLKPLLIEEATTDLDCSQLPIRTNPNFLVEHPESWAYSAFVYRLVRDIEWRKKSLNTLAGQIAEISPDVIEERFLRIRKEGYDQITSVIESDQCNLDPRWAVGQRWMGAMRRQIRDLVNQGQLSTSSFDDDLASPKVLQEQEFCHELTRNPRRLQSIELVLSLNECLSRDEVVQLEQLNTTEKQRLKIIEVAIWRERDRIRDEIFFDHPGVYLFYKVIERVYLAREKLADPIYIRDLCSVAGISAADDVSIQKGTGLGLANNSYRIESERGKYFIRYHDPLGTKFFQRHSPRTATFYHVLGERIFSYLLGPQRVIGTMFPSLAKAYEASQGPGAVNSFEKMLEAIIIQPDLTGQYIELARHAQLGVDHEKAVALYADVLGSFHGRSAGACRAYVEKSHEIDELMYLFRLAGSDVRFHSAKDYYRWVSGERISSPSWSTRIFRGILQSDENSTDAALLNLVLGNLKISSDDLLEEFIQTCKDSAADFSNIGCVGHLDYTFRNIFVAVDDPTNPAKAKVYDFDHVTFIDPAYETGQSLYSVIRNGIDAGELNSLDICRERSSHFLSFYKNSFLSNSAHSSFAGGAIDINSCLSRASYFAGIVLLSVYSSQVSSMSREKLDLVQSVVSLFLSKPYK